jgi:hypothetical protein
LGLELRQKLKTTIIEDESIASRRLAQLISELALNRNSGTDYSVENGLQ